MVVIQNLLRKYSRIITICVFISLVLIFWLFSKPMSVEVPEENGEVVEVVEIEETVVSAEWIEFKEINEEFVGILRFDSSLVNLPVAQSDDNEKYLKHAIDQTEDKFGALFMDYRNTLDDQNIIIYGHLVYYDDLAMFSPLQKLTDKSNYESNSTFDLILDSKVRHYKIAYIYHYIMDDPTLEYFHVNYEEMLIPYIESISKKVLYETGVVIEEGDKFITLQTCIRNRDDLRLIIVAKELSE